ncbi:MAG: hypothetical protein HY552_02765 [Elusimicrobia bacterium]|nr:hypothetical protein [Elusimicrobiota bacterium]
MVFKDVRAKVEKTWTTTKKLLVVMSVWGLFFSLITIARLGVAFDYDDTLVDSSAAFQKAARASQSPRGPDYWRVVNNSYELENPKILPYALAWLSRGLGFRVLILADREPAGGDALKKEWRLLAPNGFVFTPLSEAKHLHLQDGRYVLFLGSGDRDILEARRAGVYAVRVKRGKNRVRFDEYAPHRFGELVLPLSDY